MAKKDAFLLVSLEEEKARKLAAVVGNESCRKIINFLAEKDDSTETEIAKSLGLPLSTVHYNMQLLQQSGLASAEEFHYSTKGREVLHYKLANKYIIIAPKSAEGIMPKLKKLLPAFLFISAGSIVLQAITTILNAGSFGASYSSQMAAGVAEKAIVQAAATMQAGASTANYSALFLFAGGLLALAAYFAYDLARDKIK